MRIYFKRYIYNNRNLVLPQIKNNTNVVEWALLRRWTKHCNSKIIETYHHTYAEWIKWCGRCEFITNEITTWAQTGYLECLHGQYLCLLYIINTTHTVLIPMATIVAVIDRSSRCANEYHIVVAEQQSELAARHLAKSLTNLRNCLQYLMPPWSYRCSKALKYFFET